MNRHVQYISSFECLHCHASVGIASILAGNRNHCPYCLWSKHVDLNRVGDRLSACKVGMLPIGLTLKRTLKKYCSGKGGELMLIHRCVACASLSINRMAADDDADTVL